MIEVWFVVLILRYYTWDEAKRLMARISMVWILPMQQVFAGPLVLFEDQRHDYGEQRMIAIGCSMCWWF